MMDLVRKYGVVIAMALMVLATWLAPIDKPALEQVDAGMRRAFITFASARALNAAISLAQGTEINVGVGAGVTLSVGEVLDPVNDLVEQFSNVMLLATVAFGVQKVLLAMGQYEYVKVVVTVLALFWAGLYWRGKVPPRWLAGFLMVMLMVRFAVPVVTLGSQAIFQAFLHQDYISSQQGLESATTAVKSLAADPVTSENVPGFWESIKNWSPASLDPRPRFDKLKEKADQAAQHVVSLIVVFLLQTLIIPLGLLWVLYLALRTAFSQPWYRPSAH